MGKSKGQKIRLLYVADILKKYTDEDNPISAAGIIEKLEEMGISAERKAIYDDISVLCEYGMDIMKTRVPEAGYYLAYRDFEVPEIYLLSDAVQAAGFISHKKTRMLVGKLENMVSANQARKLRRQVYIDHRNKCENEEIYYSIDVINRAIAEGKKISLIYIRRAFDDSGKMIKSEKNMTVSPYALTWSDDHYYLVGNNGHYDNLMHLRIDRMKKVVMTGENIRRFSEVCEYKTNFDIADYTQKTFNMFGGEQKEITLRCEKKYLEQITDRFTDKISVRSCDGEHFTFTTKALISDGLVGWIMQFSGGIEVVKPADLREKVKAEAQKTYNTHK